MEIRYQVFVSSTYSDLRVERQEVMQALLELDCIPSGMELFPAADDDQWTLIKRVIDDCDYYMVIVAGRYGSIGPDGKSYTQMEYEYALSRKKPVIAFLHADPGKIQADRTDPQNHERLDAFRRVAQQKMCKQWSTPQELGSVVSRSIVKLMKERPGVGWVRADRVPNDSAAQEILRLRDHISKLEYQAAGTQLQGPPGTEDLAQGEEIVSLAFTYVVNSRFNETRFDFKWNELLAILGPKMIDGANEHELEETLCEAFRNRVRDQSIRVLSNIHVRNEDFQRIKVQFRALGLITKAAGKFEEKGNAQTYWMLTPYGDGVMTRIAAIRSQKAT